MIWNSRPSNSFHSFSFTIRHHRTVLSPPFPLLAQTCRWKTPPPQNPSLSVVCLPQIPLFASISSIMPTCTNQGCGQEYDPASSSECTYHPGGPVFHEGLKSWSCCKDDGKSEHKPVLEFESFVKIPGCTKGEHSEKSKPKAPVELQKQNQNKESQVDEVAATTPAAPTPSSTPKPAPAPSAPATWTILHDSASTTIPSSAKCKRRGCGAPWTGEDGAPRSSVPGFKEVKGDKEEWKVDVRGGLDAQEEEEKEEGECRFHPGSVSRVGIWFWIWIWFIALLPIFPFFSIFIFIGGEGIGASTLFPHVAFFPCDRISSSARRS